MAHKIFRGLCEKSLILFAVCVFFLLSFPFLAFSQEKYIFERMWPVFPQPRDFGPRSSMTMDQNGNIYVAGNQTHAVFKFNSDWSLITKWGSKGSGQGQFEFPAGIACDSAGNIYVLDNGNNRVQKFDSNGLFLRSWGAEGSGKGEFDGPKGICVDPLDDVYVVDTGNHRIQKFRPDGSFVREWGSDGFGDGQFMYPFGITVDHHNNQVLVTDPFLSRVQKFTFFGEHAGTIYLNQLEVWPWGIAVDDNGFFYIANFFDMDGYPSRHCILKYTLTGILMKSFGEYGRSDGTFMEPRNLYSDENGYIYVSDMNSHIQKFNTNGDYITKYGNTGDGDGEFRAPAGIAVDDDENVYVVDLQNFRVQKFSSDGEFLLKWGAMGSDDGEFGTPYGITVDRTYNIFISDPGREGIHKFNSSGIFLEAWGLSDGADPRGLTTGGSQMLYIVDGNNHQVLKYTVSGFPVAKWGSQGSGDSQFNYPTDIAIDGDGYIYVTDTSNHRVQKFNQFGSFITKWGALGTEPGQFDTLTGIALDENGDVFVVDSGNRRIQKFDSDGVFLDEFGELGSDPGKFVSPLDVAVGNSGRVYVTDSMKNRVQVFKKVSVLENAKAIIVAGTGPMPGDALWERTQMCANLAYRTLVYQGYSKERIYYLSHDTDFDIDGNGILDDVDADASNENLEWAIKSWASDADKLFIYVVGHGGHGKFRMRELQILSASTLDSWLDQVQMNIPGDVIVVYDSAQAGSFIPELIPPSGKARVLAASSESDQNAFFGSGGQISFSYYFWASMFNGNSFYDSYVNASQAISVYPQTPLIEANGNGSGNEYEDKEYAQSITVGNETATAAADDLPSIESVSPPQTLNGELSALLYAENVVSPTDITRVWAAITPPDAFSGLPDEPVLELPVVDLKPVSDTRYEATFDGFSETGAYKVAIFAIDARDNMSLPKTTEVVQEMLLKGDVDAIGNVNLIDAMIALKTLAGIDTSDLVRDDYAGSGVDVDGDDKVGVTEVIYILREVADI